MHPVTVRALWHNIWQQNYLCATQLWDIIYPVQGTTVAGNRFESAHVQHAETQGYPFPLKCRAPWHCRAILIIPGKSLFSPYDVTYAVTPCDSNKKGCGNVTAGGE